MASAVNRNSSSSFHIESNRVRLVERAGAEALFCNCQKSCFSASHVVVDKVASNEKCTMQHRKSKQVFYAVSCFLSMQAN